jgi:nicotinamide-nucleotide amidase
VASLSIHASAADEAQAKQMIATLEKELRDRLGDLIFGCDDDTLAGTVGGLLREKCATLATAESCTGGLVAKLLTDIPGSSDYFLAGWVTYSNDAKINALAVDRETINRHGAVSEPVARQLAQGARLKAGADYALAITGVAGPSGGTAEKPVGLVYIALADSQQTMIERLVASGPRDVVRQRAALAALNLLRLKLVRG